MAVPRPTLLKLPTETTDQILNYLLPECVNINSTGRASSKYYDNGLDEFTVLIQTNSALARSTINALYSTVEFQFGTEEDGRGLSIFLDKIGARNVSLLRRVHLNFYERSSPTRVKNLPLELLKRQGDGLALISLSIRDTRWLLPKEYLPEGELGQLLLQFRGLSQFKLEGGTPPGKKKNLLKMQKAVDDLTKAVLEKQTAGTYCFRVLRNNITLTICQDLVPASRANLVTMPREILDQILCDPDFVPLTVWIDTNGNIFQSDVSEDLAHVRSLIYTNPALASPAIHALCSTTEFVFEAGSAECGFSAFISNIGSQHVASLKRVFLRIVPDSNPHTAMREILRWQQQGLSLKKLTICDLRGVWLFTDDQPGPVRFLLKEYQPGGKMAQLLLKTRGLKEFGIRIPDGWDVQTTSAVFNLEREVMKNQSSSKYSSMGPVK